MSDSITKHEDKLQDKLECAKRMYAGQAAVYCAATKRRFDFTKVWQEDIIQGVHNGVIKARAILKHEGIPDICYLHYEGEFAVLMVKCEKETQQWVRDSFKEPALQFETFVTDYCNDLRDLLIEKNKSYGNSALDPIRVFSTADSEEQLKIRIDDKLSRIKRGNNSFDEDTIQDLQGYLILLQYKNKLKAKTNE